MSIIGENVFSYTIQVFERNLVPQLCFIPCDFFFLIVFARKDPSISKKIYVFKCLDNNPYSSHFASDLSFIWIYSFHLFAFCGLWVIIISYDATYHFERKYSIIIRGLQSHFSLISK